MPPPIVLTGLALSPDTACRRDPPPGSRVLGPEFWTSYDGKTLSYLAGYRADDRRLILVCPPLFNLADDLQSMRFSTDSGALPSPVHRRRKRHDLLIFPCLQHPEWIAVEGPGISSRMAVLPDESKQFSGRNVIYTLSQNNDLDWIDDWLIWHNKTQGADAVVFVDNASTSYSLAQLCDRIASVSGYKAVRVLSAPFSYGARFGSESRSGAGQFLQVAMLNAAFRLICHSARGFLNLDIDELAVTSGTETVFDLAQRSMLGYVSLPGEWRHADESRRPRHADHGWLRQGDRPCAPKYCIHPGRLARLVTLRTHSVRPLPRLRWPQSKPFGFIHHSGITTRWSNLRSDSGEGQLIADPELRSRYTRVFGA